MTDEQREGDILVAKTGGIYQARNGVTVRMRKGVTTVRRGHPIVRGFEHFWVPLVPTFETKPKTTPKAKT